MAEWFGHMLLVNLLFLSWGVWGVTTLLIKHPILGKGLVRLARRFFF
jgi:hypothetical protein